jgi:hypothetical protein
MGVLRRLKGLKRLKRLKKLKRKIPSSSSENTILSFES